MRGILAAVAMVILVAAGCGSDDDSSSDTSAVEANEATTTEAPAETTTTVSTGEGVLSLEIVDYSFQPTLDEVAVGDTLTWTNGDEFEHTSTSDDELWDSGPLAGGGSFEFTFDTPGTYAYHCDIHNFMTGEVVVS